MKFTKVQILGVLIGLGAFLDTLYGVLTDNISILTELGVSPKVTLIVKLSGMFIALFSTSLLRDKKE
jgi:hypothetical protein